MLLSRLRFAWMRMSSFTRLVRANVAATRSLNDELVGEHGVTIERHEVLSRIARTQDGRIPQADLSEPPLVTAAHVQRVLADLVRSHLVDRSGERPSSR
jgi:hypothetical protein